MSDIKDIVHRFNKIGNRSIYFIFFLICLALYFKCLTNGYSLDDDYLLSDKSVQKGLSGTKEIFSTRYISYYHTNYEYRPLTKFVFALEYQLFKLKAGPAHFVNILVYFFLCVFFFKLLIKLRFIPGKAFALLATLIFILHPLHTEAVCSIKNLDVLLSALFSLLACNFILKFLSDKKVIFLFLSLAFLICGMLSKLDTLPFFGIIPVLIWLQEPKKFKFALITLISLAVIYLVFIKTRKWILSDVEDQVGRKMLYHENPLVLLKGFKFKGMAMFSCFGFYVERLIAGFPLVCYYGYNTISMDEPFSQTHIYTGIISFLLLVSLLWIKRKDALFVFGLLMLVAPLSMYLNFPKPAPGIVADRFAFMSVSGFSLLFSYLFFSLVNSQKFQQTKNVIIYPLLLIFFFYSIKTIQRNFDWKDRLSLVEKDIAKVPNSAMMHFLKGSFLLEKMKEKQGPEKKALLDSSETEFKKSLSIFPENGSAWNYIGGIYFYHLKNYEKAYPNFKKAYELDPQDDNKILYAKSMFLSERKGEFYEFAKRAINDGKGKDFKQFISEFPQFLPPDSLKSAYTGLSRAGITDHKFIVDLATTLIGKGMKKEGVEIIYSTFENGNRDKKLAEQMAEFCYDNGEIAKASYLMDIVEGKIK